MRTTTSRRQPINSKVTAISTATSSPSCHIRSRSQSITDGSSIMSSVGEKIKEIEEADSTSFLQFMDEQVHETWDTAKAAMIGAQRLLHLHELPKEWQENEYILSG